MLQACTKEVEAERHAKSSRPSLGLSSEFKVSLDCL